MTDEIVRKEFPTPDPEYAVQVTTERLPEGRWAVVATIRHSSDRGVKIIDLPVPQQTFEHQADAEDFGARTALDWFTRNRPRSAA